MKTKPVLSLSDAQRMLEAAKRHAEANNLAVAIAVADDGGHLLGLIRLDGAAPLTSHIAPAKAHAAALGRRETKGFEDMINQGRTAFVTAPAIQGMLEGGVPVVVDGQVIGAVGVSGVKPNEDAEVARAGIAALGA
ncbi:heme-binding protein [Paracandidimonas soli]|uniref:heme-binding protein n=1 Tax=Paracandidimonas soli TaxID=1917182 RepID=UPI00334128D2